MNKEEHAYLNLLQKVLSEGEEKTDRTGTGTKSLFGETLRFSLKDNTIPLLTTKKVFWKGVVEELLFFINGKTQTKELEAKGVNIWKGNTSREFLDNRGLKDFPEGEMGEMYGAQWRRFGENNVEGISGLYQEPQSVFLKGIDQLQNVFNSLKDDPHSRRHVVSAWNPQEDNKTCLLPCHYAFQFYVSNKNELSLMWQQRSVDSFLGLPFNIASYALLTHLMANALGYTAKELIFNGGDIHIYNTHIEQCNLQVSRSPFEFPKLKINKNLNSLQDIEKVVFEDLELIDYKHHDPIKAKMAI